MSNVDKIFKSIQELKKADKTKEIEFENVKLTIKVITVQDEIDAHIFSSEFSNSYPEKERGYVYIQKLKEEVVLRSIIQINDIKFEYKDYQDKQDIITSLRPSIKELSESLIQIIYENHNLLMTSYKDDFDIEVEKMVDDDIKKLKKELEENKKENDEENIEIKVDLEKKSKEEIEKNNKFIEKEFETKIENDKVSIIAKKDILEIKKDLESLN